MRYRFSFFIAALFVALFAASYSTAQFSTFAQPAEQLMTPDARCASLVEQAVVSVGSLCGSLGRNTACYGNRTVAVDFKPNSKFSFNESGDVVDLLAIQRLSTAPLNPETNDWGISIVKAQANLPDTLPGQNVTFLLFGDTTLDDPSPEMRAVTIDTRIGAPACIGAPNSAVLIQSPEGTQVEMNLNGADVTLGSTAFVTAIKNGDLTFSIVEGTGIITAQGITRVVTPGAQVRIPLGTEDGLHVVGPPSDLEPFDFDSIDLSPLSLLDRPVVVPQPIGSLYITPTPTNTIAPCFPRTDWTFLYTVPRGDTLSAIAARIGMTTADLAAGNCISNPNLILAGQTIRTPRAVPPPPTRTVTTTATVAATATPTATSTPPPPTADLSASPSTIHPGQCATLTWTTTNAATAKLDGAPVGLNGSQEVCTDVSTTTTYTLVVEGLNSTTISDTATVSNVDTCGNAVCDPWENSDTCSDCGYVATCGNGVCDSAAGENVRTCSLDCTGSEPVCGNGVCEPPEDADTCTDDCG